MTENENQKFSDDMARQYEAMRPKPLPDKRTPANPDVVRQAEHPVHTHRAIQDSQFHQVTTMPEATPHHGAVRVKTGVPIKDSGVVNRPSGLRTAIRKWVGF